MIPCASLQSHLRVLQRYGQKMKCPSPLYWTISTIVFTLCGALSFSLVISLEDWDFFVRSTFAAAGSSPIGLFYIDGPYLSRLIFSNQWILATPVFALGVFLLLDPSKSFYRLAIASLTAAFIVLLTSFLTAYLPVAKPEWWFGDRPDVIYPSTSKP